jgi:hypothetical protein
MLNTYQNINRLNNPSIALHIHSDGKEVHQLHKNPTPYLERIDEKLD